MERATTYWRRASIGQKLAGACALIAALGGALAVLTLWLDAPGRTYVVYAVEREYALADSLRSYDARIDSVSAIVAGMRRQVDTLSVRQQRVLTNQADMMLLMVFQGGSYTEAEKRRILTKLRTGHLTLDSLLKEAMLR